jgi:hypothetical protein
MRALEIGRVFGRLTVVGLAANHGGKRAWSCLCSCGSRKDVAIGDLLSGGTRSCGCLRAERARAGRTKHGLSSTPEYAVWQSMKDRCQNERAAAWVNYGGRGVKVCPRWSESFEAFLADMGPRPSPRSQLDRRDNSGDYEPSNCRWATRTVNNRNTRSNRIVTVNGVSRCVAEWSEISGLRPQAIIKRLNAGWGAEAAVFQPPKVSK